MENFCAYITQRSKQSNVLFRMDDPLDESVAWSAFDQEVEATADFLVSCHIQEKEKILCLVSCPHSWLKLFFAALKIGAVPILVNFRDTFFLQSILAENVAFHIVMDKEMQPGQEALFPKAIVLKEDFPLSFHKQPGYASKKDKDILCSLYTSGSTGKPKYIEKTYQNLLTELQFLKNLLEIQEHDVVLSLVPNVHIYGLLFGLLLPTLAGSQAVYTNRLLPREVMKIAVDKKASFLIGTPIHYQVFIETHDPNRKLSSLKLAVSSGGTLAKNVAKEFFRLTGVRILEIYGSTETGGIAYRFWDGSQDSPSFQLFPYIEKKIDSPSEIQELVISSPAISPNALRSEKGVWYDTGDFVQFDPEDGNRFKIVGRQEQIMKVGGKRISTTQLEEEIKAIRGVKDVAVIRIETSSHRESGVAFVEMEKDSPFTRSEIQKEFQKRSAHYRSVSDLCIIDKIPRNQNGKILYAQLQSIMNKQ